MENLALINQMVLEDRTFDIGDGDFDEDDERCCNAGYTKTHGLPSYSQRGYVLQTRVQTIIIYKAGKNVSVDCLLFRRN